MSQLEQKTWIHPGVHVGRTAKKPYHKPAVRYEHVFETSALSCGKVQTTQGQCHSNRKHS